MTAPRERTPYLVTTPIYYVNDAPHVGHVYTTLIADALARAQRSIGRDVFLLTGTDEHSERVIEAAHQRGLSAREWSDLNAQAFREAFAFMGFSHDDFIRTSQDRHKAKVCEYIAALQASGDIHPGEYTGWWDHSQEEYLTETIAREHDFKSPVTGKPLVRRSERNHFFRLSAYQDRLLAHIEANPHFLGPEARKNEVLGRIRQGLQDVPVSRAAATEGAKDADWGIPMPGDPTHRVYVWIDALFIYLSVVDTPERSKWWPAAAHLLGKDILWFHAVVWPCLLMALGRPLPHRVYAHSYWIREGRKMSKSLGNFLDLPTLRAYAERHSLDALRWFLLTNGPAGATDADFAHAKFVEVYNANLANGIGNAASRVANMVEKWFDGKAPDPGGVVSHAGREWNLLAFDAYERSRNAWDTLDVGAALRAGLDLARSVDAYIHETAPFKLIKDEANRPAVAAVLYHAAEALRISACLLQPAMPTKMADLLRRLGQNPDDPRPLKSRCVWGGLEPGTPIVKGEALFPRADTEQDPPTIEAA